MIQARVRAVLVGVGSLALVAAGFAGAWPQPVGAATPLTVDNAGDGAATPANCTTPVTGQCTLRDAFAAVSTGAADGADAVIDIPATVGTITLSSGPVTYTGGTTNFSLNLVGNGTTVNQTSAGSRVITSTTTGTLTVSGLTISGGAANGSGGGIRATDAVALTNVTVTNNSTIDGGGGVFAGSVTATGSTFSTNHANGGSGGGIETPSGGNVTLTNSTVTTNTADDGGGGVTAGQGRLLNGTLTMTGSTIDHNTASDGGCGDGGGAEGGTLASTNSTVTNNVDSCDAGGGVGFFTAITLAYTTIASNSAANGANLASGPTAISSFGTVVALPLGGGTDCVGTTTTSHGYNWDDDASCGFGAGPGDHTNAGNPNLGPLADNDATTLTRLPLAGSGLIDAIPTASCQADGAAGVTTDQRGISRPQGAGCDIGAVEVAVTAPAPLVITPEFTG